MPIRRPPLSLVSIVPLNGLKRIASRGSSHHWSHFPFADLYRFSWYARSSDTNGTKGANSIPVDPQEEKGFPNA